MHYLDDDIESIAYEEYNEQNRRSGPERDQRERERHVRRQQRSKTGLPERYEGSKEDLARTKNALLFITVSGRRQRLREKRLRTRPTKVQVKKVQPFQPPARVSGELEFQRRINEMTLEDLKDQVRVAEDEPS
eukprot:1189047-Amphidinium_carterae.1